MAISLAKVEQEAPALLNMAKQSRVSLEKNNLNGVTAKVVLVLDHSGSQKGRYQSGSMQRLAERALAIATSFDDDGNIDLFFFDTHADYMGEISLSNYQGSIDRLRAGRHMGTTAYDKAFYAVRDHFGFEPVSVAPEKSLFGFKKKSVEHSVASSDVPVYAIFLTDGAPNSKPDAVRALTEVSYAPIFWKFLSIGKDNMEFLQKLDDLDNRYIDNADYQHLGLDVDSVSDEELFDLMLVEFKEWLVEAKQKNLLV